MALIRSTATSTIARGAVVLDLGDLHRQGESLRSAARAEAERIVAQGRAERARLIDDASALGRETGYADGFAAGRDEGAKAGRTESIAAASQSIAAVTAAWGEALADFERRREAVLTEATEDVVRFAVHMAERIIKRALMLDPGLVKDQVAHALRLVMKPTAVVLAVAPADEAIVKDALPQLLQQFGAATHAEVRPDASLAPGSCVVRLVGGDGRTDGGGEIDASIASQIDELVGALLPGAALERSAES